MIDKLFSMENIEGCTSQVKKHKCAQYTLKPMYHINSCRILMWDIQYNRITAEKLILVIFWY